jgi:Holliday junction resolvasome RuvABC DNA-binding subunit
MKQHYRVHVVHQSSGNVKGLGKYGLSIKRSDTGVSTGLVKHLFSDEELRGALDSLGYEPEQIADILEMLTAKKSPWNGTRDLDESAVAALGF